MNNVNINEIRSMTSQNIENQINELKKILLDFRVKQATKQSLKPHLIRKYKKQIARLMTVKHEKIIKN
uniref:Large ribosomal subunit protein uL29c n=1 Tax=Trichogloeopsis pedicellata TaxID=1495610 RepID=A0A1G4P0N7_9FLOR|nr:Ribosomal protein L29 [Trichogloeopsis pedicellata]SCW24454.1 Ribosomal protein L29 [Trichogloeopsis pedicellata]